MDAIDTIQKDNCTIEIYQDDNETFSPREWCNLGTMVCWHNRYNLGDVQLGGKYIKDKPHFTDMDDLNDYLKENKDKLIVLPLYLYEHSGITMSVSNANYPFNDRWDSGCVGIIYVTYEQLKEEYGYKIITKERKQKAIEYLKGEVATYDDYLTGNIYGYKVFCDICDPDHDDDIDSCWGFYGDNWKENGILESANTECPNCKQKTQSGYLQSAFVME